MNRKKQKALWISSLLIAGLAVLILVPLLCLAVKWICAYFGFQTSPETLLGLYVAFYTLEATVIIAILIYYLQKQDVSREEIRRAENAKRILAVELAAGIDEVVRFPRTGSTSQISRSLPDMLVSYLPDLQRTLSPDMLHHLIQVVDFLSAAAQCAIAEDWAEAATYIQGGLGLLVRAWICPAMRSPFADGFSFLKDYREILNEETFQLMVCLTGEGYGIFQPKLCAVESLQGGVLLEVGEKDYIKIHALDGSLLCDARLDSDSLDCRGIESGWAKLNDYVGDFKDGKRHGLGCAYDPFHHRKLNEGTWERGDFLDGTEFDMVVRMQADDGAELLGPYWQPTLTGSRVMDYATEACISSLWVCDRILNGKTQELVNFRKLKDFIKMEDPRSLRYLDLEDDSGAPLDEVERH